MMQMNIERMINATTTVTSRKETLTMGFAIMVSKPSDAFCPVKNLQK